MNDEKKLILQMLSEGKISVTEADKLLTETVNLQDESLTEKAANKKFLKILVNEGGNTKVNINIPMALAETGLKLVPKDKLKIEGTDINIDEILKLVRDGSEGELVNIETIKNDKEVRVRIAIE
jgi:hypothetical protein